MKCLDRNFTSFQVYKNLGIAYYRLKRLWYTKIFLEKAYYIDSLDVNNVEFLSSGLLKFLLQGIGDIFIMKKYIELSGFDIKRYSEVYQNLYDAL